MMTPVCFDTISIVLLSSHGGHEAIALVPHEMPIKHKRNNDSYVGLWHGTLSVVLESISSTWAGYAWRILLSSTSIDSNSTQLVVFHIINRNLIAVVQLPSHSPVLYLSR